MRIGEPPATPPASRLAPVTLAQGQGWSLLRHGDVLLLRALPLLTGAAPREIRLTEAQAQALIEGSARPEDLIAREPASGRGAAAETTVTLSDEARRAAQAGLAADPGAPSRTPRDAPNRLARAAPRPGQAPVSWRLPAVALVALLLFLILLGVLT